MRVRQGYIKDNIGYIPLTRNMWALCDPRNFHWLSQWNWYASHGPNRRWYARRNLRRLPNGKRTGQLMHRLIMGVTDPTIQVDHKDREATLDNRSSNLRLTVSQNPQNRGVQKNNTSGVKGVSWDTRAGIWKVQICHDGKNIHLGQFYILLEAAQAYNEAALKYHGEFAVLNDPSQITQEQLAA